MRHCLNYSGTSSLKIKIIPFPDGFHLKIAFLVKKVKRSFPGLSSECRCRPPRIKSAQYYNGDGNQ